MWWKIAHANFLPKHTASVPNLRVTIRAGGGERSDPGSALVPKNPGNNTTGVQIGEPTHAPAQLRNSVDCLSHESNEAKEHSIMCRETVRSQHSETGGDKEPHGPESRFQVSQGVIPVVLRDQTPKHLPDFILTTLSQFSQPRTQWPPLNSFYVQGSSYFRVFAVTNSYTQKRRMVLLLFQVLAQLSSYWKSVFLTTTCHMSQSTITAPYHSIPVTVILALHALSAHNIPATRSFAFYLLSIILTYRHGVETTCFACLVSFCTSNDYNCAWHLAGGP